MGKKRALMLDSKKGKKKDPHTDKWERCIKKVSLKETDEVAAKICTDSIKEESKHVPLDENKIISLLKQKENPRMTKKGLTEYISKKKVVKTTSKNKMITEDMSTLSKSFSYFRGESGAFKKVMKYLEMIRQSGLENMYGVSPLLNWSKDEMYRYLYGKGMDPESIESKIEESGYDEEYSGDVKGYKKSLSVVNYLLDNKQEIRDILIRVALRKSEETGDHGSATIQRHFLNASKEVLRAWMVLKSI